MRKAVQFLYQELGFADGEIIVHFVTQAKIARLHKEYFNDPTPTDCITFPVHSPDVIGEVFICPKIALKQARAHQVTPKEELLRYVVHCLLHLCGYNDIEDDEQKEMKKLENHYLKKLRLV